ncbi:MAG: hypothetical protein IT257_04010 [Chitinophagaceae bacterium]|nr:hypothetical protein [Chitinophagaceae bacterium]
MTKKILLSASIMMSAMIGNAQLYSSGNTVIAGTNVGIGTNTPTVKLHVKNTVSSELLRLENTLNTGFGKFTLYNDNASNYATFTKYGSAYASGVAGFVSQYPFANMLSFGNNNGPLFISNSGAIGISMYKAGANVLKFNVNYNTGNVGLGGSAVPMSLVHINSAVSGDTMRITNSTSGHTAADGLELRTTGNVASIMNRESSTLELGTNNATVMKLNAAGTVLIGNTLTPAGYKLFVEQGILTEKIKVSVKNTAEWSDYVFANNYKLLPLTEVESFINSNSHLPGVPSAAEVVNDGINVATMDAKLLEKIEELTLYIIDMNKRIENLENENNALKSK